MKFKTSLIIRLVNNSEHRSLTDVYSKVEDSRELIETMFPGVNYHTSLGEFLESRVIPELKQQFPHLISNDSLRAIREDMVEIIEVRQTKSLLNKF